MMINNNLTVVMYHYVRDLKNSRFPSIKGLDVELFKEQISYLQKHYNIVNMEDVKTSVYEDRSLPERSVLLTFDDGYSDHFMNVYPILLNKGLQGSFFAPVKAIEEHTVLDVNKIHFILASVSDTSSLLKSLRFLLDKYRSLYVLKSFEYYYKKLALANRFDSEEIIFIKRLLQVELDEEIRKIIVDELFVQIVGMDEEMFSRELYMNKEQLRCMVKSGMHIGSHGYNHYWLASLNREQQEVEIKKSLNFIQSIGGNLDDWTMCYPYGSYNEDTLSLLKIYGCRAGFTTEVNVGSLTMKNILTIPRLDTNDIPKEEKAPVNDWFFRTCCTK